MAVQRSEWAPHPGVHPAGAWLSCTPGLVPGAPAESDADGDGDALVARPSLGTSSLRASVSPLTEMIRG